MTCQIAVILAAGTGTRLGPFTRDMPKALVEVDGAPLLGRTLALVEQAGFVEVHIVTGHAATRISDFVEAGDWALDVQQIHNAAYATTNNIWSVAAAAPVLARGDVLLIECDVAFDERALAALLAAPAQNTMLVSPATPWMDGGVVETDAAGRILRRLRLDPAAPDPAQLKTANLAILSQRFSTDIFLPMIEARKIDGGQLFYDEVLGLIIEQQLAEIHAVIAPPNSWIEIDTIADQKLANDLFSAAERGSSDLQGRHGGYWRLPDVQDSCLLVNPFFPPADFIGALMGGGDALLRGYPSGHKDQAILASRLVGVSADRLVIGNGASELIAGFLDVHAGRAAMTAPSFEEYYNRLGPDRLVLAPDAAVSGACPLDGLLDAAMAHGAKTIIHVNPQNPTGEMAGRDAVLSLIERAGAAGIQVLIDESFADFAEPADRFSLFDPDLFDAHPNLHVLKSISKTYGLPGLRIGVLATSKIDAQQIRTRLPIWNINSLAERALELLPQYGAAYEAGLDRLRRERAHLFEQLAAVPFLSPWPSAANFILCEVRAPWTAAGLTQVLLRDHHIMIKDCSGKRGANDRQLVRIAVGTRQQTERLSAALAACA